MKTGSIHTTILLTLAAALVLFAAPDGASAYDRQSSNENGVRVDVKPLEVERGKSARFEIRLNTHSVNLSQDMTAVSVLETDGGTVLRPEQWEGSGPGGHHRSGVLHFSPLPDDAGEVTLTIKKIAGVPERTFRWKVE